MVSKGRFSAKCILVQDSRKFDKKEKEQREKVRERERKSEIGEGD